jgi:hypothetical protein
MTRVIDTPVEVVSFLVVADDGESGWGVDVTCVEAIVDSLADNERVIDSARFGFPGDAERPLRVLRLRGHRDTDVAVRRKLQIVTVPRAGVHALPGLIETSMQECCFSAVVFVDDRAPFLILDVDGAFEGAA